MKKIYLAAFVLSLVAQIAAAQSRKLLNVPQKYLDAPDGTVLPKSVDVDAKINWIVCSDRANNPTFEKPGAGGTFKTMNYMEKFYVTDEEGDYLQLYKYEEGVRESGKGNRLKSSAIYYGWAPKKNLLMWLRCLQNENHLGVKALPILNESNFKDPGKYVKNGTLRLFSDPGLSKENGNAIKMFQFVYVFKQEGNSILLAKSYLSNFYRIEMDVLGWVSKDIVQVWNDRVCLEPNWDEDAVANRKSAGIKSSLFVRRDDALGWQKGASGPSAVWDDDSYATRKDPYWKRFPILDIDKQSGIVKTGYVTNILDEKGIEVVSVDDHTKVEAQTNKKIEDIRVMNLVFVMDAGSGMSDYVNTVRHVVDNMKDRHLNVNPENKIRFGAVVYRDEQDKNCPGGDLSVNKTPGLSPNTGEMYDFLEKEFAKAGCKNTSKGVGPGLYTALRMLKSNSRDDQTNIVVLIGGAKGKEGNPLYSEDNLATLVADTKANLLAFQVTQGISSSFEDFPTYISNILRKSSKKLAELLKKAGKGKFAVLEPKFKEAGDNTYLLDYPATSTLMGTVSFANKGQTIPAENMTTSIDHTMKAVEEDIERKIGEITATIIGFGKKDVKLDASILRYFTSIGQDVPGGHDLMKKYTGHNYQFFIPGYTSIEVGNLQTPVYKKVLYLGDDEMDDLKNTFRDLAIEGSGSEVRSRIVNTYIAVLASYLGDKKAKEVIGKTSPGKVWELVTGLPTSNKLLNQHSIADYKNPQKVDDDEIRRVQNYLLNKFEAVKSVVGDPKLTLKLDWGTFYWVPEDYLP